MVKTEENTGIDQTFPAVSLLLRCTHVGLAQLRMTDMWNDKQCDNTVRVYVCNVCVSE